MALLEKEVPKEDIILEEQARNTYENCIFSIAKINEHYNLSGEIAKGVFKVMKHLTNACQF